MIQATSVLESSHSCSHEKNCLTSTVGSQGGHDDDCLRAVITLNLIRPIWKPCAISGITSAPCAGQRNNPIKMAATPLKRTSLLNLPCNLHVHLCKLTLRCVLQAMGTYLDGGPACAQQA